MGAADYAAGLENHLRLDEEQVDSAAAHMLEVFEREGAENPYATGERHPGDAR